MMNDSVKIFFKAVGLISLRGSFRSPRLYSLEKIWILIVLLFSWAQASVTTLDFAGGNGTASVDQYAGTSGSGWAGGWTTSQGASTTGSTVTVTNADPVYSGGGNYLSGSYSVAGGGGTANQYLRVSRQVDSASIDLSSIIQYSFVVSAKSSLVSDTNVSSQNHSFNILSSSSSTALTASSTHTTWGITSTGDGWFAWNGGTSTRIAAVVTPIVLGSDYRFTILSDASTDSYSVVVDNLSDGTSISKQNLGWRNAGSNPTTENTYLHFVSASGSTPAKTLEFDLDNISVTAIPEPSTWVLMAAGLTFLFLKRRQLRRCKA